MPRVNYRQTDASDVRHAGLRGWLEDRPQLPYLLPFMAFVGLMAPGVLGEPWSSWWRDYHPLIYTLETAAAAVLLWLCWRYYTPIRWGGAGTLGLGVLAGLIGTVLWVGIEYGFQRLGWSRAPDPASLYNPDLMLHETWQRWAYLCIRVAGPTLVVPVMEELFFRDFLMRALVRGAGFQEVPVGTFTWFSFLGTAILFGVNHGKQWPEGVVYGLLMGLLLVRTKSLGSCIVAHGTTNFTLYLFVIYFGDWQFL